MTIADILKIIKDRRSIRKFQKKEIPTELVEKIKEALIWAPSAGNLQARKFYFVFNQEIKDKLNQATFSKRGFLNSAPLIIVGCADSEKIASYSERGKTLYIINDVSVSIQNAMLMAQEAGLGSCWVGAFEETEVSKILNLPQNLRPIVLLPVGYPAENPLPPERATKEEAVEERR